MKNKLIRMDIIPYKEDKLTDIDITDLGNNIADRLMDDSYDVYHQRFRMVNFIVVEFEDNSDEP